MKAKILILFGLLILIASVVAILLLSPGCASRAYPSDNEAEEWLEEIIQEETGWDIDLTPFSPEN